MARAPSRTSEPSPRSATRPDVLFDGPRAKHVTEELLKVPPNNLGGNDTIKEIAQALKTTPEAHELVGKVAAGLQKSKKLQTYFEDIHEKIDKESHVTRLNGKKHGIPKDLVDESQRPKVKIIKRERFVATYGVAAIMVVMINDPEVSSRVKRATSAEDVAKVLDFMFELAQEKAKEKNPKAVLATATEVADPAILARKCRAISITDVTAILVAKSSRPKTTESYTHRVNVYLNKAAETDNQGHFNTLKDIVDARAVGKLPPELDAHFFRLPGGRVKEKLIERREYEQMVRNAGLVKKVGLYLAWGPLIVGLDAIEFGADTLINIAGAVLWLNTSHVTHNMLNVLANPKNQNWGDNVTDAWLANLAANRFVRSEVIALKEGWRRGQSSLFAGLGTMVGMSVAASLANRYIDQEAGKFPAIERYLQLGKSRWRVEKATAFYPEELDKKTHAQAVNKLFKEVDESLDILADNADKIGDMTTVTAALLSFADKVLPGDAKVQRTFLNIFVGFATWAAEKNKALASGASDISDAANYIETFARLNSSLFALIRQKAAGSTDLEGMLPERAMDVVMEALRKNNRRNMTPDELKDIAMNALYGAGTTATAARPTPPTTTGAGTGTSSAGGAPTPTPVVSGSRTATPTSTADAREPVAATIDSDPVRVGQAQVIYQYVQRVGRRLLGLADGLLKAELTGRFPDADPSVLDLVMKMTGRGTKPASSSAS